MKGTYSLLQALAEAPAKTPTPVAPAPVEKSYLIYVIESDAGKLKIGVPVENVAGFDAHFDAKPEHLMAIEEHLAKFDAVILE